MMIMMMSVDRDDRVDDHNNNNDKSNTSSPSYSSLFLCFFFCSFLISTIIVISLSLTCIVKCVHINTGGTETAAACVCKELLSFCLTPVCFSLWIFLTLKKYYDRKIPRRVTFRVNGLHAVLIVSIHPQTSRLAHTLSFMWQLAPPVTLTARIVYTERHVSEVWMTNIELWLVTSDSCTV